MDDGSIRQFQFSATVKVKGNRTVRRLKLVAVPGELNLGRLVRLEVAAQDIGWNRNARTVLNVGKCHAVGDARAERH